MRDCGTLVLTYSTAPMDSSNCTIELLDLAGLLVRPTQPIYILATIEQAVNIFTAGWKGMTNQQSYQNPQHQTDPSQKPELHVKAQQPHQYAEDDHQAP